MSEHRVSPLEAMQMALAEARKGYGFVSPNPAVGCVILDKQFRLLSVGYHHACGQDHAEVDALKKVKDLSHLEGAHVFVTLEPCAHQGRTPSCAKTLAKYPLAKVTYALEDPNPLVAGQGAEIIKRAGIEAELMSELSDQAEELAEIFLHNMRTQRPFVALKVATSLDGQMALISGESQWITNEEARYHSQYLRGCYDSVLIGLGTFLADNPRLNSRHPSFAKKTNQVIVLDSEGQSSAKLPTSSLMEVRPPESVTIVVRQGLRGDWPEGVKVIECPLKSDGQFDLTILLESLYKNHHRSIYVEGGASVFASFLASGLVQRLYQFIAPCVLGARGGLAWTKDFSVAKLSESICLSQTRYEAFGDNILVSGRLS